MDDTRTVRIIIEIPIRKDENVSMPIPTTSAEPHIKEESPEEKEDSDLVYIRNMSPNELNEKLKEIQQPPHEVTINPDGSVTEIPPTATVVPDSTNTPTAPIDPQHFEEQVE